MTCSKQELKLASIVSIMAASDVLAMTCSKQELKLYIYSISGLISMLAMTCSKQELKLLIGDEYRFYRGCWQ